MPLRKAALAGLATLALALAALAIAPGRGEPQRDGEPAVPPAPAIRATAPMVLGAASNFSQGFAGRIYDAAFDLGVEHYRDGMSWTDVERAPGRFTLHQRKTQYPARLAERGGDLVLTVGVGNPLYDGGETPVSPEALAAFGEFVGEMVRLYPAISAIEIGNEFNSANFVSGAVRETPPAARARYHLAMVRAAAQAARAVRSDITILGGAAHSIPAGYLWPILDGAEPGLLDGLAIHPYSTPVDQLARQLAVLRRHPAARIPIHVTEFGTPHAARAPGEFVRAFAALASAGVASFHWYPLSERGDGAEPLLRRDGSVTPTGEAFRFVKREIAPNVARDLSPDPFTFVHAFGERAIIAWGAPRRLTITGEGVSAFDARGRPLERESLALSAQQPVILLGESPIALGRDVVLGCRALVADSFYQFAYPPLVAPVAPLFASHARLLGRVVAWRTQPGQQRRGVPWVPYLEAEGQNGIRLTAEEYVLAGGGSEPAIVHSLRAPHTGRFDLRLEIAPRGSKQVRHRIEVRAGDRLIHSAAGTTDLGYSGQLALSAGEDVSIVIARDGDGAATGTYRLRLFDPDRCPAR